MISSTAVDLGPQRAAAHDACERRGFEPKMMENNALASATALEQSMQLVDQADVYVLILGFRYGLVPDEHEKSLTHLEFERATERGIPRIRLLMDESPASIAANGLGIAEIEGGEGGVKLSALRAQVRKEGATSFDSPDDLKAELIDALATLASDFGRDPAPVHYARVLATPPEPYVAHPYILLGTSNLVGRQRELNVLTDWVTKQGGALAKARLLNVVAIGGMGKSALIWHWFDWIAPHEMQPLSGRVWWSFYESDASFENFVTRTLAYTTGRSIDAVALLKAPEREDQLLAVLNHEPYLIVLDGLERLLLAYTRLDAAYLADDDLDARAANVVAGALGLPAGAADSYTGQPRLRTAADPRVGSFLRRLAKVSATRVLASSRLYPADLQDDTTMRPIPGAGAYFLRGLTDEDAVDLWRGLGVSGSRDDLVVLFRSFDNYPLLIRALAGEVARFRPAPGDFAAWQAAHPEFDPFSLPLLQRKSHVLKHALDGLGDAELRLLRIISAFRMPTTYGTLVALAVGPDKPFAREHALDIALSDLEERGLLGWDRHANRYDLHPVVRGVAWASLDDSGKRIINEDLARHFEALPSDSAVVTSMDDLSPAVELFNTLLRLDRAQDAFNIWTGRIGDAAETIGSFRDMLELGQMLAEKAHLVERLDAEDQQSLFLVLGFCADLSGQPLRSLELYDLVSLVDDRTTRSASVRTLFMVIPLRQAGLLLAAEQRACEILNLEDQPDDIVGLASFVHGLVLETRSTGEEAKEWLEEVRNDWDFLATRPELELAWWALRHGDIGQAEDHLRCLQIAAGGTSERLEEVQFACLQGAIALRRGDLVTAGERLHVALLDARTANLRELEAKVLTLLAEWELANGRTKNGRARVRDLLELMGNDPLRLLQADALNVLSTIERRDGNRDAAAEAAERAYRAAWCDGPPFAYARALDEAGRNLAAVEARPPDDLPPFLGPAPSPSAGIAPLTVARVLVTGNDEERLLAVKALALRGDDLAVPGALASIINPTTRAAALSGLVQWPRDLNRWRALVEGSLMGDEPDMRAAAIQALALSPTREVTTIAQGLATGDSSPIVRAAAITILPTLGQDELMTAAQLVEIATADLNSEVISTALESLSGMTRSRAAVARLVRRAVADANPIVRMCLLEGLLAPRADFRDAIADLDDELVAQVRIQAIDDPEPRIRSLLRQLLVWATRDEATWALLLDRIRGGPNEEQTACALALIESVWGSAPETLEALAAFCERTPAPDPEVAFHLAEMGHPVGLRLIRHLVTDPSEYIRMRAMRSVVSLEDDQVTIVLLSRDADGLGPPIDPALPVTEEMVARMAAVVHLPVDEVKSRYERLAEHYPLNLEWHTTTEQA